MPKKLSQRHNIPSFILISLLFGFFAFCPVSLLYLAQIITNANKKMPKTWEISGILANIWDLARFYVWDFAFG